MTSRSKDRIARLATRRAERTLAYGKARRRHRGAGKIARELKQATTALLREEIRLNRARPPQRNAAAADDLFAVTFASAQEGGAR